MGKFGDVQIRKFVSGLLVRGNDFQNSSDDEEFRKS